MWFKKVVFFSSLVVLLAGSVPSVFADSGKGVGPVTSLSLGPIDVAEATKGKGIFKLKCSACHKLDQKYVGPALKDVTKRRQPEWVMNMILNPVEMTQKDPVAQELLGEYLTQMASVSLTQADARSLLEYFRHVDEKGDLP